MYFSRKILKNVFGGVSGVEIMENVIFARKIGSFSHFIPKNYIISKNFRFIFKIEKIPPGGSKDHLWSLFLVEHLKSYSGKFGNEGGYGEPFT